MSDAFETPDTGDTAPEASNSLSELFELVEGKNEAGEPITKQFSRDDLLKLAQKGLGADKTFQESSQARQEAKALQTQMANLARMMQESPFEVLKAFNQDPDAIIKEHLNRQLAEQLEDPRDRELAHYKRQMGLIQSQAQQARARQQEAQLRSETERINKLLTTKIDEALTSTKIPKSARVVKELASFIQNMSAKDDFDLNALPVDRLIGHIHNTYMSEFDEVANMFGDDALLERLSPQLVDRISRAMTKKLSASATPVLKPKQTPKETELNELESIADRVKRMDVLWKKANGITD